MRSWGSFTWLSIKYSYVLFSTYELHLQFYYEAVLMHISHNGTTMHPKYKVLFSAIVRKFSHEIILDLGISKCRLLCINISIIASGLIISLYVEDSPILERRKPAAQVIHPRAHSWGLKKNPVPEASESS